jgi:hypothetical protein
MRWVAVALLLAAGLAGGCAGWSQTPYNPQQACDIVGGVLTADGRCLAGNR